MNQIVTFLLFSVLVFQEPNLTEVLRVGGIDGEDAFVFGRVLAAELSGKGTLFVLDAHASEVRMFDQEGHHMGSFGRAGEGPGEFRRLRSMDWHDGQITVTQGGRLSLFGEDGEFLNSHRIPGESGWRASPVCAGLHTAPKVDGGFVGRWCMAPDCSFPVT